ncbi:MAG: DUF899 family protein [Pseudonocardiaceae bacterium]
MAGQFHFSLLLVNEKEATRARDALAAERRQLPMVPGWVRSTPLPGRSQAVSA